MNDAVMLSDEEEKENLEERSNTSPLNIAISES
jgi:hypothetical protein